MDTRFWLVGGAVRDAYLGVRSKDLDFTVEAGSFAEMRGAILGLGGEVFLEREEYLTVRARLGLAAADFVLARADGAYSDGRRPDEVRPGTITDDLARRDFTCNAIAVLVEPTTLLATRDPLEMLRATVRGGWDDPEDPVYDPHGGRADLRARVLRAVGSADARIAEDPLRALRALRFQITRGLSPDHELARALRRVDRLRPGDPRTEAVSPERVREELDLCCRAPGGFAGLQRLLWGAYPHMGDAVLRSVSFRPTLEPAYPRPR